MNIKNQIKRYKNRIKNLCKKLDITEYTFEDLPNVKNGIKANIICSDDNIIIDEMFRGYNNHYVNVIMPTYDDLLEVYRKTYDSLFDEATHRVWSDSDDETLRLRSFAKENSN